MPTVQEVSKKWSNRLDAYVKSEEYDGFKELWYSYALRIYMKRNSPKIAAMAFRMSK